MNFKDKKAFITGATSGIGAAFAEAFAAMGVALTLTGRRTEVLDERRRRCLELGAPDVRLITGPLEDSDVADALLQAVRDADPSVLVNNVGFGYHAEVSDADPERLAAMISVQAELPTMLSQIALNGMTRRREGLIINVGSLAGRAAVPGAAVYVATKIYLERLSESMAIEAAPHGVVVQALAPGYVRTDFHREYEDYENRRRNRGLIRWMNADAVVEKSLQAAERAGNRLRRGRRVPRRRDVVVVPGLANRFLASASSFVPRSLIYRAAASRATM